MSSERYKKKHMTQTERLLHNYLRVLKNRKTTYHRRSRVNGVFATSLMLCINIINATAVTGLMFISTLYPSTGIVIGISAATTSAILTMIDTTVDPRRTQIEAHNTYSKYSEMERELRTVLASTDRTQQTLADCLENISNRLNLIEDNNLPPILHNKEFSSVSGGAEKSI
jgi:hypothetical protein